MRSQSKLKTNHIDSIDDTKTTYSILQSKLQKAESRSMKDSMTDFSVVIESLDQNKNSLFGNSNSEFFKVRQEMAKKLYQVLEQNEQLKQKNKQLHEEKLQIKKDLQKIQKENRKNSPTKNKNTQCQHRNETVQKTANINKNQFQLKIGSLKLQLQRQMREKEIILSSFNQQKNNMLEELRALKIENQARQNKQKTLYDQLNSLQEKVIKAQNQIEELQLKLKNCTKKTEEQALKSNKISTVQDNSRSSISKEMREDKQYSRFLFQQLYEKAATLYEDNAVLSQKNKSVFKANCQLKIKIKQTQDQNNRLIGKLSSFQSLIRIQNQQLNNMIKTHDSQLKQRTQIQSNHLQKKYQFYKTELQTLRFKNSQLKKSLVESQSLHKGKIIELQKALVKSLIPSQQQDQINMFSAFCGDLYSNLFTQYERLSRENIHLKGQIGGSSNLNINLADSSNHNIGKIMKQSTVKGSQDDWIQQQYLQSRNPLLQLNIKKIESSYQRQQWISISKKSSVFGQRMQSDIPKSPVTESNHRKQNPEYFIPKSK